MNAESSDWKRFIPVSDELNSIYDEIDSLSKQTVFEESCDVAAPLANRHVHIFGSMNEESVIPPIEQQLQ